MRNLAIVYAAPLKPGAFTEILDGPSAFDRVLEWARTVPGAGGTLILAGPDTPLPAGTPVVADSSAPWAPVRAVIRESWTEEVLIDALALVSTLDSGESPYEAFFYTWGDCPLIDHAITGTLWDLHYRYDAQYTFADGYPAGLAPEVLSPDLPGKLRPLAAGRDGKPARDSLFEILRRDINAFDVETHLSPEDLRLDRVSLTSDTRRNRDILQRLHAAGGVDAESMCRIIPAHRNLLRSLPAFFPIQITDYCPQACSYCPFALEKDPRTGTRHMEMKRFAGLCRDIAGFAGDAVIGLSLWGEPAAHPRIEELVHSALDAGGDIRVLIETSGIGWDSGVLERLAAGTEPGRLLWIVSLDAADPELYRRLRGDGLEEAERTAGRLIDLWGRHCWIQAVRMTDNDEHMDAFYPKWKDRGAQVIVQKYDSFARRLPERQPSDLSPLNRFPCWHIKRDMPILIDGSVPVCRSDLGRRPVLGNVFADPLQDVWRAGQVLFENHIAGEYPGPCADCDEYYTFNF